MRFRKKPVVIDAFQWDGTLRSHNHLVEWTKGAFSLHYDVDKAIVSTLEGEHIATVGDWIVRGVKGEFYPVKPDIFAMTYERVEEDA